MRFRTLIAFGAVTALFIGSPSYIQPTFAQQETPQAGEQSPVYMEVVPLRYADPAVLAKSLNTGKLPEGTTLVKADSKVKRGLRIVGTQEAIDSIKEIVKVLDVAPRKITLRVILERVNFGSAGKKTTRRIDSKTINALTNADNSFSLTDETGNFCVVTVTPHLSRGAADTVLIRMGVRNVKGYTVGGERATTLPTGQAVKRIMGVTFADDKAVIVAVGTGNQPATWKQPFIAYYTSVKVVPQPLPGKK